MQFGDFRDHQNELGTHICFMSNIKEKCWLKLGYRECEMVYETLKWKGQWKGSNIPNLVNPDGEQKQNNYTFCVYVNQLLEQDIWYIYQ